MPRGNARAEDHWRDPEQQLIEAEGLAEALDLEIHGSRVEPLRTINASHYFGEGKSEALKAEIADEGIEVLVVDATLSPVQQRNLERQLLCKVVDRTGLILEIFGRRARTREGRLQVELARLDYERSRLVRTWTHLERQRGGLGKTGGPGESQLELDRRQIAAHITRLKKDLDEVRRTRALHRASRKRRSWPVIACVGYTNAGKSTLFNALTQSAVFAKNMPFATLDPTTRGVELPDTGKAILIDTVGFIAHLPTELVAAFRATLEEVLEADILLHVRDVAHPDSGRQREDVLEVLARLATGAEATLPPIIEVWNKIDLLPPEDQNAWLAKGEFVKNVDGDPLSAPPIAHMARAPIGVAVSATEGTGLEGLLAAITLTINEDFVERRYRFDPGNGAARAFLYAYSVVLEEKELSEGGFEMLARMNVETAGRFEKLYQGDGAP